MGVDYASADISAMAGSDYTAVTGSLSFADGEISKTFSVDIIDDADYEGDETLSLSLSNPTGGAGLGSPALKAREAKVAERMKREKEHARQLKSRRWPALLCWSA